ncbi:MAG TPA: biopolymer transporter ExbD [Pirellulales bacterium]|jgi:biopolymer transport protein ExbD|nr:biopolymer transporter ExbD [Pirellulales bacterium]
MAVNFRGPVAGNVNMMPMIDILFQIVIFFLVAAQIQIQERSLPIVLPKASAAMPLTAKPKEFFVHVDRDGHFYAGGNFIELDALERELNQAAVDNPERQSVVIRADEKCAWKHVVAVMNACNKVGISDYRVTTAEPGT